MFPSATFKRSTDPAILKSLRSEPLFNNKLLPDIRNGMVFPAIRGTNIDFYYKGGNLFKYRSGKKFSTHIKYASVLNHNEDYLTETQLQQVQKVQDFSSGYERIKENCAIYSGVEAAGVSEIYNKYSYIKPMANVVILDIEVSIQSLNPSCKQDRIDVLLLNKNENKLKFVEVKHFSNPEIWSTKKPKVIDQIDRYQDQIQAKKIGLLNEYNNYIQFANQLFGLNLPQVTDIIDHVSLLVFGFDSNQKNGRLRNYSNANQYYNKVSKYEIGNIKQINMQKLWNL